MNNNKDENGIETRQERRQKKLEKKKERIRKHGKSLAQTYRDAILKRLGKKDVKGY